MLRVFTSNRKLFVFLSLFLSHFISFSVCLCTLIFIYIQLLLLLWMALLLFFFTSVGALVASAAASAAFATPALMLFVTEKIRAYSIYGFSYVAAVRYFSVCASILHCVLSPSEKMEHASQPPLYRSFSLEQHLRFRRINYRPLYKHNHKHV